MLITIICLTAIAILATLWIDHGYSKNNEEIIKVAKEIIQLNTELREMNLALLQNHSEVINLCTALKKEIEELKKGMED